MVDVSGDGLDNTTNGRQAERQRVRRRRRECSEGIAVASGEKLHPLLHGWFGCGGRNKNDGQSGFCASASSVVTERWASSAYYLVFYEKAAFFFVE